jgi:hypothetical protein
MRAPGATLVAVDLFEQLQEHNVSASGSGSRAHFERNMSTFFGRHQFCAVYRRRVEHTGPGDLGNRFSFCHIDGGHTAGETYQDLELCSQVLLPGGLVALDDYFNPAYPACAKVPSNSG